MGASYKREGHGGNGLQNNSFLCMFSTSRAEEKTNTGKSTQPGGAPRSRVESQLLVLAFPFEQCLVACQGKPLVVLRI